MKYRLINKTTKEEHICDKVTIDGFDYYVSDEKYVVGENCIGEDEGPLKIHKCVILNNCLAIGCKKIIATNNPNIDIPKVVGAKLLKYKIAEHEYPAGKRERKHTEQEAFINGWNKCLQSQETHPFSEEDMIEFAIFYEKNQGKSLEYWGKDLFKIWKEQQPKIVYYE